MVIIATIASAATGVKVHTDSLNTAATAQATAKTQQARQKVLGDLVKRKPAIQGFRVSDQWSTASVTDTGSCAFGANNTTYIAVMKTAGEYWPCMAKNPPLGNLALQVTMKITGDAGGVIFRSDGDGGTPGTYYRLSVNQSGQVTPGADIVAMYLCRADCFKDSIRSVSSGTLLGYATSDQQAS